MMSRVFITGMGAVTASGMTLDETWAAVCAGRSSIGEITQWSLPDWPHALGGEIKNYRPRELVKDRKLLKLIARPDVLGLNAATQAVEDSGILDYRDSLIDSDSFNNATGVYVGSPGNKFFQQYDFIKLIAETNGETSAFADKLFDEVHPMWLLKILPNNVLAYTGIQYGFKGPNQNITNHVVSGAQALIEAFHAVRRGQASRAVVVAYDLAFEPQAYKYYDKLGILSDDDLKPFDDMHSGTLLAEGAAAMVIESEESVALRQASPVAEVLTGATVSDAMGIFPLEQRGIMLTEGLKHTLASASVRADDVGMVTAHGNGNQASDISESIALNNIFNKTPVTGFKWSMGHCLAASGLLDAVLTTRALIEGIVPGIANFSSLSKACAPIEVSREKQRLKSPLALTLCRGFGGLNTALIIKAS